MNHNDTRYFKDRLENGKPVYALHMASGDKCRVIEIKGDKARTINECWINLNNWDLASA